MSNDDISKPKIVLVLGSNTRWAPYYFLYEGILLSLGVPFDLIIWNRENTEERLSANNVFEYKKKDVSNNKNASKVFKFIGFSSFVKKIIKKQKYEKIIFLGLHGCAGPLNSRFLVKKYNKKYWVDIRDYHYEWFKPYYRLEKRLIINSYKVVLSSPGFVSFLPKHEYINVHNIDPRMSDVVLKHVKTPSNKIRISFIGNVRYIEENKELLRTFSNDDRFLLQYFGFGSDDLIKYCNDNHIENVLFYNKPFEPSETVVFYTQTDVINNVYGSKKIETKTALSNKLYYSIFLNIPILVSKQTFMEEFVTKFGLGIGFDNSNTFPDKLYEWYKLHLASGTENYKKAQCIIEGEMNEFKRVFKLFIEL